MLTDYDGRIDVTEVLTDRTNDLDLLLANCIFRQYRNSAQKDDSKANRERMM
jgi:hypothetical protein